MCRWGVAFLHHIKNFLLSVKEDISSLKVIDFGLADFLKPGLKLTDFLGTPGYIAPELRTCNYGREVDIRSIGALAKFLSDEDLIYFQGQFNLIDQKRVGHISDENLKTVLSQNVITTLQDSRISEVLAVIDLYPFDEMNFEEFCAATLSIHQLRQIDHWWQYVRQAYEHLDAEENRFFLVEDLASEVGLKVEDPETIVHLADMLGDWITYPEGRLSFRGFIKLLNGDVRGRIYISEQGINAQGLSSRGRFARDYAEWVKKDPRFSELLVQASPSPEGHAFPRLRLQYKPSLVQVQGGTQHLPVTDPAAKSSASFTI
ncbi:hypothetical protein R1sor_017913 [Riccia sorocarpa]|uniref:Protein kinase domain-containing protein n=1 Tax=Riccia sorocarpa TaxID=122646 RepID=A0ABD3I8N4_9MARC